MVGFQGVEPVQLALAEPVLQLGGVSQAGCGEEQQAEGKRA